MSIAAIIIIAGLVTGIQMPLVYWLMGERTRLVARMDVQSKRLKREKMDRLEMEKIIRALISSVETRLSERISAGEQPSKPPSSKPVMPRTGTQAKREAEARLASLTTGAAQ